MPSIPFVESILNPEAEEGWEEEYIMTKWEIEESLVPHEDASIAG